MNNAVSFSLSLSLLCGSEEASVKLLFSSKSKKKRYLRSESSEAKNRRTSVSRTYLPLAIGAIYSGRKPSLSLVEWTFSLKVALTRRTKGSLPGVKKGTMAQRTLKYAEFTPRSREYGNATDRTRMDSHANLFVPPIKVTQFRDIRPGGLSRNKINQACLFSSFACRVCNLIIMLI